MPADPETVRGVSHDTLIDRLRRGEDPDWLIGDVIGALSALTGEPLGWHPARWVAWWDREGLGN